MKKIVLGIVIVSLFMTTAVLAAETKLDIDTIRTNCDGARSMIQRIVSSDKTSRINRGRAYDRMSNLFLNFIERLRQNNINSQEFIEITNQFNLAATNFRIDYDDYKNSIDDVINRECVLRPNEFYGTLTDARSKRKKVNDDINILNEIIERYQAAVGELNQSLYKDKKHE